MKRFDVVIVGARCAGSPLAAMLARDGMSVCLLDRARFPSETPSTHVIQPCGVAALDRVGVLREILAAGAVPIDRFTLVNDDVRIEKAIDRDMFDQPALCVRRVTLDALLVNAAGEARADVRTSSRVTGLMVEDGRVVGVETAEGPIRADLVVGADGRNSTIAACVNAPEYHVAPPGRMVAWAYFEDVSDREGWLRLGQLEDIGFLASPTDSDLYMAGVAIDFAHQAEFHADRVVNYDAAIRRWPELADLVAGARRVGPVRVVTKWHGYFRQAAGAGWVLVGDAGHFKDFTPAQGISDALRQAERLAGAIRDGLGSAASIDDALREWWRWRDEDSYEMHWFASDMGEPGFSSPLVTRILRDISTDAEATELLLRVLNHEVRPSQLLTTPRLARGAVRALRDRPGQMGSTLREIISAVRIGVRRERLRRRTFSTVGQAADRATSASSKRSSTVSATWR
jgi:menaquinone-9 beta-reductase